MAPWNRQVSLAGDELEDRLLAEIKRRWPDGQYPFHIEVVGAKDQKGIQIRLWDGDGLEIIKRAFPEKFISSPAKSPTVAAVIHAVESAVASVAARPPESGRPR